MGISRNTVIITTDASGAGTGYTPAISGKILQIRYVHSTYDANWDLAITGEDTGIAVLTKTNEGAASASYAPRQPVHATANAAVVTYDGTRGVAEPVCVWDERVKIVVAEGGNTKTGTFYIWHEY